MVRLPFLAVLLALAVSGCTSTADTLEPSAMVAPQPTTQGAAVAPLNAALAARTRLHFDPIIGASVEAATPLTERLVASARARGITLAGSNDPSTTHVLKGYFSVLSEGGETTVIYVWDVYDNAGNRLHRINGQQKSPPASGEGWGAVPAATMQAIADQTIDQFGAWLASRAG